MNEDDTFRKLKQVPIAELLDIINNMPGNEWVKVCLNNSTRDEFLRSHGWILSEYLKVYSLVQ